MSLHDSKIGRRTVLRAGIAGGITAVAGCLEEEGDGVDEVPDGEDPDDEATEQDVTTEAFEIETVADGFTHPWGLAFLPDGNGLLVTEREGNLTLVDRDDGSTSDVDGVPDVYAVGQGGMLDVTLYPAFPEEKWVYLTYSAANDEGGSATHVGRGRLDGDDGELMDFERLHVAEPFVDSTGHFGSRAVFGPDNYLYVTTGDRQFKDFGPEHVSQDLTNELGVTLRLEPDGSIPADNPFVDDPDAGDGIYSYGHRNAQGMTVHPETGEIWQSEHGERDGDEINVIQRGGNYGWPVTHYGCTYAEGEPIGEQPHERDDVVDPVYYWECNTGGFPPAGATFYSGGAFPAWDGDLFVGNLAGQYLGRFVVDGTEVREVDPLLDDRGWRIRDVAVAPDTEHLYVAVDAEDAPVVRLVPEE